MMPSKLDDIRKLQHADLLNYNIRRNMTTWLFEKRICDCTQRNTNKIITNLTNITWTQDETSVLGLGSKHGVPPGPKDPEMFVIAKNVWEQIEKHEISKAIALAKLELKLY